MSNILLLVDGATKKIFSDDLLSPLFKEISFLLLLLLVGCYHSFHKTIKEVNLKIESFNHYDKVILIYDYYGLHPTFKKGIETSWSLEKSIEFIRDKFTKEINSNKFYFYIQVQEFEALLYSNINEIDNYFETNKLKEIGDILNKVKNNLELINDSTETVPSKRLDNLFSNFGKTTDGIVILKNIGIDKIRNECA